MSRLSRDAVLRTGDRRGVVTVAAGRLDHDDLAALVLDAAHRRLAQVTDHLRHPVADLRVIADHEGRGGDLDQGQQPDLRDRDRQGAGDGDVDEQGDQQAAEDRGHELRHQVGLGDEQRDDGGGDDRRDDQDHDRGVADDGGLADDERQGDGQQGHQTPHDSGAVDDVLRHGSHSQKHTLFWHFCQFYGLVGPIFRKT